jgi:hypothetical protein
MDHGNKNEDKAGIRYAYEVKDIGYEFGIIPHADEKWRFHKEDLFKLNEKFFRNFSGFRGIQEEENRWFISNLQKLTITKKSKAHTIEKSYH